MDGYGWICANMEGYQCMWMNKDEQEWLRLNKTEYDGKKILKPAKWSKSLNNYSTNLEGVKFDNLSYEQFMIISKYSDDI